MSVTVSPRSSITPPGVVPSPVAVRWQTSAAPRQQSDDVTVATPPTGALPAVDIPLPTATSAKEATAPTLVSGLLDGAKDNITSLVRTVKDKPFLSGAVVLGYQALILTPFAGLITGGLAALGVVSLAKKGIAAVNAHNEGDLYGAGKALGSGLTDLGLTHGPKLLGRVGDVKAAKHAADIGQAVSGESTLVTVTNQMIKSARVAKRGVTWAEAAQNAVNRQTDEPPALPAL
jgi:hypothetical protein